MTLKTQVQLIPTTYDNPAWPLVDGVVGSALPGGAEAEASGHFVFGGDAASLVSLTSPSVALTPASPTSGPPAFDTVAPGSMTISSAGRHGLYTPFRDAAYGEGTVALCLRQEDLAGSKIAWGTATTVNGDGGQMGFLANSAEAGNATAFLSRGSAAQLRSEAAGFTTGLAEGDPYIQMWSWDNAHGLAMYCPGSKKRGGPNDYLADSAPRTYVSSTDNKLIALGNIYYQQSSWQGGVTLFEAVFFPWRMTLAEMIALKGRIVGRQADRPTPVTVKA